MIEGLFQPTHLIIILAIVLVVFGPGKLANAGGALGKSIKEFKTSSTDPRSESTGVTHAAAALPAGAILSADSHKKAVASDPANV